MVINRTWRHYFSSRLMTISPSWGVGWPQNADLMKFERHLFPRQSNLWKSRLSQNICLTVNLHYINSPQNFIVFWSMFVVYSCLCSKDQRIWFMPLLIKISCCFIPFILLRNKLFLCLRRDHFWSITPAHFCQTKSKTNKYLTNIFFKF